MSFLFVCGIAFAVAFVLRLITRNSWLSLATPVVGYTALSFWGGEPDEVPLVLTFLLLTGLFGAAWGVVAAKMVAQRAKQ